MKGYILFIVFSFLLSSCASNYVQEIGRAGRDRKASRSTLFFHPKDKAKLKSRLRIGYPELSVLDEFISQRKFEEPSELSAKERVVFYKLHSLGVIKKVGAEYCLSEDADPNWKEAYLAQSIDGGSLLFTVQVSLGPGNRAR